MELYRSYVKKSNNFPKYFMIVVITVLLTLFADRTIKKANEIDEFAQKLSFEEKEQTKMEETIIMHSEDYIESILESTVGISVIKPSGSGIFNINIEEDWGLGTGIIVSEKGYILTNQHLAKKVGAKINITLNSGKSVEGKIVWNEENIDLAIIKIDEHNLKAVKIGNDVIAIRKSFGKRIYRNYN